MISGLVLETCCEHSGNGYGAGGVCEGFGVDDERGPCSSIAHVGV